VEIVKERKGKERGRGGKDIRSGKLEFLHICLIPFFLIEHEGKKEEGRATKLFP